jgi:hypothetical protein
MHYKLIITLDVSSNLSLGLPATARRARNVAIFNGGGADDVDTDSDDDDDDDDDDKDVSDIAAKALAAATKQNDVLFGVGRAAAAIIPGAFSTFVVFLRFFAFCCLLCA